MRHKSTPKIDQLLVLSLSFLVLFGLLMVFGAATGSNFELDLFFHQLFWIGLGLLVGFLCLRISPSILGRISSPLLFLTLFLLSFLAWARFFPLGPLSAFAPPIRETYRWLVLNPEGILPSIPLLDRVIFQPSELAKLSLIIYLAELLSRRRINIWSFLLPFTSICFLVALEPNFSEALILASIGGAMYFISGSPLLPLLTRGGALALLGLGLLFATPYGRERVSSFLNPSSQPQGSGYHRRQILIALGSGGIFGRGLGQSRQKFGYLPEVVGDSIFALIGEEFGFLGALLVIAAFALLLWRLFALMGKTRSDWGRLLCGGMASWLGFQTLINLGAMTGLIPLTGTTLPLISYGGSSILFTLAGLGLVLGVVRK